MTRVNNRPLTIGVLIGNYEEAYPRELRDGLYAAARQQKARVIFFVGKSLRSPTEWQQNITYYLANSGRVDGLIIATGGIGNFCSPQAVEELCRYFNPLPVVGIGTKFPGIPTVSAENRRGMRNLLSHLLKDHGYRRIAFISGPGVSQEAEERLAGYCDALAEYGIQEDPELIIPGDFSFHSGVSAVHTLLNRGKLSEIEVLVGINDASIYGALYELEKRGFFVPRDLKVAGFDDADEIEYQSVPLTTVSQSIYQQGFSAMTMALDFVKGREVPEELRIPTRLIIRQSCGCTPGETYLCLSKLSRIFQEKDGLEPGTDDQVRPGRRLTGVEGESEDLNLLELLWKTLKKDISAQGATDRFERLISDLLADLQVKSGNTKDYYLLQELIKVLCDQMATTFTPNIPAFVLSTMEKVQARIGNALLQATVFNHNRSEVLLDYLRRFYYHTNNAFSSIDELMSYIGSQIHSLGVRNCYVSLYESEVKGGNDEEWQVPEFSRLIMAYRHGAAVLLSEDNLFPTHQLIPASLYPHDLDYPLVVMSLVSRDKHFGFIVFEDRFNHNMVFDMVREQISNSLYTFFLYHELQDLSVRDELTGLYNRRGFILRGRNFYQQAKAEGRAFYVFFCDMDGLKQINDNYGHKEGDFAIGKAAEVLEEFFTGDAIIARLGGDEFIVIVSASYISDIEHIREDFTEKMQDMIGRMEEKPYLLSMSMGFSMFNPVHPRTLEELVDEADRELYKDKGKKQRREGWLRPRNTGTNH